MNKKDIFLIIILVGCFLISIFLHEVGHGISAYAKGYPVSTGFNKVGNAYAKPGDVNFRDGFEKYKILFDLGPIATLALAVIFTALLYLIDSKCKVLTLLIGAFALCNSVLRLIPIVHSYSGFLLGKGLLLEDEIGIGLILNEIYNSTIFTHVTSMISLFISFICLSITIKLFKDKLPELYISRAHFITLFSIAGLVAFYAANYLDRFARINWVK